MIMMPFILSVIDDKENEKKFLKLYNKYEAFIFKIAYSITDNFHNAEDATQTALFALAKNIDKIDLSDVTRCKIYVCKAAKSAAIDIIRKENQHKYISLDSVFNIPTAANPEMNAEESEELEIIIKTVEALPHRYRDALSLFYLGNFSTREIASIMQISCNTAKSIIRRGKNMLYRKIKEARSGEK